MRSCAHPEREKCCGDSGAPRGTCGSADGCGCSHSGAGSRLRAARGTEPGGVTVPRQPRRGTRASERHWLSPERLRGEARFPRASVSPQRLSGGCKGAQGGTGIYER